MQSNRIKNIILNNLKDKDVGIGILHCISEPEQVENLQNDIKKLLCDYHDYLVEYLNVELYSVWVDEFLKTK